MQSPNSTDFENHIATHSKIIAVHELVLCIILLIFALLIRLCRNEIRKQNDVGSVRATSIGRQSNESNSQLETAA